MSGSWWKTLQRPLDLSAVRYLLVGGIGELAYLILFWLVTRAGGSAVQAIAVAGAICLVMNAVLHARISFRVRFRLPLLISYVAVQLLCLPLSLLAGWGLERLAVPALWIALVSMALWSATSFLLTRRTYRRSANQEVKTIIL